LLLGDEAGREPAGRGDDTVISPAHSSLCSPDPPRNSYFKELMQNSIETRMHTSNTTITFKSMVRNT